CYWIYANDSRNHSRKKCFGFRFKCKGSFLRYRRKYFLCVERRYSNMDLRKLIFLILLPVCIYGQNEVIRRIEFEDSIRVHSDTLLSHNDRINAVVQLSKDSTSGLRDEINALTDTAGVHLDSLQAHNDRILALLDSILSHYSAAEINLLLAAKYNASDFNNDFDTRLGISQITESQISDLQAYLTSESDPITLDSLSNNIRPQINAFTDSLKNIYTESQVYDLLDDKHDAADTWSLSNRINAKSETGHTHVEADITNLAHYTEADIDGSETAFNGWDKDASDD